MIITLNSYHYWRQARSSIMELNPISNRQKREAGVLRGACRSCREFFGSAKTRAVIYPGSFKEVVYYRTCRDLEISKEAGCVLCKTFVEIDAVRDAEYYRKMIEYRLDEREIIPLQTGHIKAFVRMHFLSTAIGESGVIHWITTWSSLSQLLLVCLTLLVLNLLSHIGHRRSCRQNIPLPPSKPGCRITKSFSVDCRAND